MNIREQEKFGFKLVHELTELDTRESKRPGFNPYALPQYIKAANEVIELIDQGNSPEKAFSVCFIPTRGMHTVAKHLGLKLDVQKGHWIQIGDL